MLKQGLMAAAAALALAACNNPTTDQAADNSGTMADNGTMVADDAMGATNTAIADSGPAAMPAATAAEFVQKMGISDMYEIESSKLAQSNSRSAEIKAFAKQMIADHTATTTEIKAIAAKDPSLAPPKAMDDRHQKLIADLKAATPETFDAVYAQQQTAGHEEAHALLTAYADGGDNADLKAFAAKTAPKVQMHLDMIRKIAAEGGAARP